MLPLIINLFLWSLARMWFDVNSENYDQVISFNPQQWCICAHELLDVTRWESIGSYKQLPPAACCTKITPGGGITTGSTS